MYWALYKTSDALNLNIYSQTPIFCGLILTAGQFMICLVVHSLVAIVISRCFTICFPMKRFFKSKTWTYLSIIAQWIFGSLMSIPILLDCLKGCSDGIPLYSWIFFYYLLVIVIIPVIFFIIFNGIIIVSARLSSRRVHATTIATAPRTNTTHQQHHRDIKLLKHILFLFFVFIFGWAPTYIATFLQDPFIPWWVYDVLQIPPTFTVIIQTVDLFIYNREVRQYWKERINRCFR
ncbi:unnamed protein product [Adineta steineri]|uniref:G-protein coupled receptors family 1 profile domain-containing protein n=1 Tax=Adineta steineri TaxID=433720 RepID=A0A814ZIV1_9BILA|nr:unnamed protein product [Adineta steineri]CAF1243732.1 unnamed protein product [Adineta steineri]